MKKPTESYCPLTAEILAFGSENRERDARAIYMYTYVCNKYYILFKVFRKESNFKMRKN